jgi:hypothetical protein
VPADRGTGRIAGDEELLERLRRDARELRGPVRERADGGGRWGGRMNLPAVVVVVPAEVQHGAPRNLSAHAHFVEGIAFDLCEKRAFLLVRKKIRNV